jgi:uncharacterized protein
MDYEQEVGYCLTSIPAWQNENRMSLLRILTWILIIWGAWFMIKNYLAKQTRKETRQPALPAKMVKCHLCSVHTPASEAFFHDAHWFCNQEHMQAWLGHKAASGE